MPIIIIFILCILVWSYEAYYAYCYGHIMLNMPIIMHIIMTILCILLWSCYAYYAYDYDHMIPMIPMIMIILSKILWSYYA